MIRDYAQIVDRLSRGLGKAYAKSPMILGVPGMSLAVKIDPYYYLAILPAFLSRLGQWAGVFPDTATEALAKTGNLITGQQGDHQLPLTVLWGEPPITRRINAAFVPAEFIERALKLYGAEPRPLPVADLRILEQEKEHVDLFMCHITRIDKTAFARPV